MERFDSVGPESAAGPEEMSSEGVERGVDLGILPAEDECLEQPTSMERISAEDNRMG
jgi:hypothetical protein